MSWLKLGVNLADELLLLLTRLVNEEFLLLDPSLSLFSLLSILIDFSLLLLVLFLEDFNSSDDERLEFCLLDNLFLFALCFCLIVVTESAILLLDVDGCDLGWVGFTNSFDCFEVIPTK